MGLNVYEVVWSENLLFREKLDILTREKLVLDCEITNTKEYPLDINFEFTKNLEKIHSKNQQWKQVALALRVIKLTRRWDRRYKIDTKKTGPGSLFIDFFKDSINVSKRYLCQMGINFFANDKYTFKTFIIWAHKLVKNDITSETKYNEFMKLLERNSYNAWINECDSNRDGQ